jgi:uncharacterized protein YecE (DUF72 family)
VQQTFYKIPSLDTLRSWRREAPPDFEFTLKAWQVVTHPPTSPTWRKAGISIDPSKASHYGYLRPTKENFEAWEKTLEAAKALNARVVVVQTPPTFGYTSENLRNAIEFFRSALRPGIVIAWEPRGTWNEHPEMIRRVVEETGVVHVVDLLRRDPVLVGDLAYFRLHGLGGREVNYRYKYSDEDLKRLLSKVAKIMDQAREAYVMFNNVYMFDDAKRFKQLLASTR